MNLNLESRRDRWRSENIRDIRCTIKPLEVYCCSSNSLDETDDADLTGRLVFFAAITLAGADSWADFCSTIARLYIHENVLHVVVRSPIDQHMESYLTRAYGVVTGRRGHDVQYHHVEKPGPDFKIAWLAKRFQATEIDPMGPNVVKVARR